MERKCGRWQLRIQERDRTYGRIEAKGEKSKQRLNLNLETREIDAKEADSKHQKQKEDRLNQQFKIWATPCISFLYFRLLSTVS